MRHEKRITIEAKGRDIGKTYLLLEMPADQGERWATRAILALANAGSKLPEGVLTAGMEGLAITWRNVFVTGILALQGLQETQVRPLLDELKLCIRWCPPGEAPPQVIFNGNNSQIEEIATFYTLYLELVQLHLGFSMADILSTTGSNAPDAPAS